MELRRQTGFVPHRVYAPYQDLDGSACSYYRIATPLRTMQEMGLAKFFNDRGFAMPEDKRIEEMSGADIQLYYLLLDKAINERVQAYREHRKQKDMFGASPRAPKIVFDSDDNIEFVDIFNPKFNTLGTRLPSGQVIKKGEAVNVTLDDDQPDLEVWRDGLEYPDGPFDVEHNLKKIDMYREIIRDADGVTTTTDTMKDLFFSYGAKNIHVFPNSLRSVDYPAFKVPRPRNKVRILWQGGYSHFVDWHPIRLALGRVFRARPNAELVVWGMLFPAIHREVPEGQLVSVPWGPYSKYTLRLATIGHHINLAPLARNKFNDCKSPIKVMESAATSRPAVTLAADGPVYGPHIEHGKTGMLYDPENPDDFEEKLIGMIDDIAQCDAMAEAAREYWWDTHDATKTVLPLWRWYRELKESS